MRIVVGIDPGLDGGVAVLNESDTLDTAPLPTMGEGKHRVLDIAQLVRWLRDRDVTEAIMELSGAMPDQGRASIFRYGVSFGQLLGMCQGMLLPYVIVSPLRWKRHYGLLNSKKHGIVVGKDDSRRRAIELFPANAHQFARKLDTHRAEAALIARYGMGPSGWARTAESLWPLSTTAGD
jgi:hypothetical protein